MEKEVRPIQEIIGARLKELRESRKLSRVDIAEILECGYNNYCRYEAGIRKPSYEVLLDAAEYYGVSMDFLMGRTPAEGGSLAKPELLLLEHFRRVDTRAQEDVLDLLAIRIRKSVT